MVFGQLLESEWGVRFVEEQYAWQSGDGTTLFGLEVRTPTIQEAQNKRETVQSERVQCVKVDTSTLDDQKAWTCVKTPGSYGKNRIKKLVTCGSDKDLPLTCKKHEIADVR